VPTKALYKCNELFLLLLFIILDPILYSMESATQQTSVHQMWFKLSVLSADTNFYT